MNCEWPAMIVLGGFGTLGRVRGGALRIAVIGALATEIQVAPQVSCRSPASLLQASWVLQLARRQVPQRNGGGRPSPRTGRSPPRKQRTRAVPKDPSLTRARNAPRRQADLRRPCPRKAPRAPSSMRTDVPRHRNRASCAAHHNRIGDEINSSGRCAVNLCLRRCPSLFGRAIRQVQKLNGRR